MDLAMRTGAQETSTVVVTYFAVETDCNSRRRQSCGRTDLFPRDVNTHTGEAVDPMVLGVGAHGARDAHGE